MVRFTFEAQVIYWRGPSPFFYAPIPLEHAEAVRRAAKSVSYGWGMVPARARVGPVAFDTALFPKDATYLLPLRAAVRRKTDITAGDVIIVDLTITPAKAARGRSPLI